MQVDIIYSVVVRTAFPFILVVLILMVISVQIHGVRYNTERVNVGPKQVKSGI